MIVLLTNKFDISVDFVVRYLREHNEEFLRINTEDLLAQEVQVSLPDFSYVVANKEKTYNLAKNLHAVLFRRPGSRSSLPLRIVVHQKQP